VQATLSIMAWHTNSIFWKLFQPGEPTLFQYRSFSSMRTSSVSGSSTPGSPALLQRQGSPAPHMQPSSSCQGRSVWFSQTQPIPKHMGQFLSMSPPSAAPPGWGAGGGAAPGPCLRTSQPAGVIQPYLRRSHRNETTCPNFNRVVSGVAYITPAERIEKAFDDALGNGCKTGVSLNSNPAHQQGSPRAAYARQMRSARLHILKCTDGIDNRPANVGFRNEKGVCRNLQRPVLTGRKDEMHGWPSISYASG
jgi:hypothetical protein